MQNVHVMEAQCVVLTFNTPFNRTCKTFMRVQADPVFRPQILQFMTIKVLLAHGTVPQLLN